LTSLGPTHHPAVARDASVGAALACALLGYLQPAEAWLDSAEDFNVYINQQTHPTNGRVVITVRGIIALERLEVGAATALPLFEDLDIGEELWALAANVRAQAALSDGSHPRLLAEIEKVREQHARQGTTRSLRGALLVAAAVDLHLALGQISRARTAVESVTQRYEVAGLAHARIEYLAGDFAEAVDSSTEWLRNGINGPRHRLDFLLIVAAAEHARGRRKEAVEALAEAVAISKSTGLVRCFLKVPNEILVDLVGDVAQLASIFELEGYIQATDLFPPPIRSAQLSDRELEVLASLAQSTSLAGVARSLYLSSNTVKTHLRSIYRKLGTHSSVETVERAKELGLLG
jgi:LuxR family transcriptional regulator, maltose regulon positive regulatory protein